LGHENTPEKTKDYSVYAQWRTPARVETKTAPEGAVIADYFKILSNLFGVQLAALGLNLFGQ
jgi:hypothetical protein